ncbi:rhomboid family intramembrane serine protease [Bifidobacterium tibiigranuli]|uniref:Rhomboid family intramembrane serine protease n=1 Tax=Bifidobacterium tibiigranuli TaxID=2172043 RepID=A0A5N6S815_9BIFI|nr:rhomboid family intramembrane serine protease [Bifidobacterium tibiigranuli]KAE8126909.1 rhomboid family intramembrane serine protease [Bifidobacterium tibiigranuli]KAE8129841.1 rhomboid family intramembrane serine protease [Bifidobacterium tibiigranuli]
MANLSMRSIRYDWHHGGPVVTQAIIAICVAAWLLEVVLRYLSPSLYASVVGGGLYAPYLAVAHPWSWLTSLFLHAQNPMHVGFNMLTLWMVGPTLERMMGHWSYLGLYLISGLGGAAGLSLWAWARADWSVSAYGASGALFGLFAALLVVYRRMGVELRSMLIWMAINFAMPLVIPNVAWQAHAGGFVVGGLLTVLLVSRMPGLQHASMRARMWTYGGAMVVVLAAVIVLCAKFAM